MSSSPMTDPDLGTGHELNERRSRMSHARGKVLAQLLKQLSPGPVLPGGTREAKGGRGGGGSRHAVVAEHLRGKALVLE